MGVPYNRFYAGAEINLLQHVLLGKSMCFDVNKLKTTAWTDNDSTTALVQQNHYYAEIAPPCIVMHVYIEKYRNLYSLAR